MKLLLSGLLLLAGVAVNAQKTSGTDFWMAFLQNADNASDMSREPYYLRLTLSSQEPTTVTISNQELGFEEIVDLPANSTKTVKVPFDDFNNDEYGVVTNKSLHITSLMPVSVYAENYQLATTDATLILPVAACGSYYIVQNNVSRTEAGAYYFQPSYFNVVAFEDNTEVEITPTLTTTDGRPANQPFIVVLNKGEVYQVANLKADMGKGLSGSQVYVRDNKKVAVYSGNRCSNVPDECYRGDSDMLFDVSYPVSSWGKNFIIRPFKGGNYDMIKVTACKDGTKIFKDGELVATIDALQSYEFFIKETEGAVKVSASEPVSTYQYMTSIGYLIQRTIGGPSYQYVAPIEQAIEDVTFSTMSTRLILTHYLNLVIKTADAETATLNGAKGFATFTPIDDVYSTASVPLEEGQYTLHADNGFVANVYGAGKNVSYSYSCGSKIDAINSLSGEYIVTYDGNGATGGEMSSHTYKIGVDETTHLDPNQFVRQYVVLFDTREGEPIAPMPATYGFVKWTHDELLTEVTNNMENWNNVSTNNATGIVSSDYVKVNYNSSVNEIDVETQYGTRERFYSGPVYMPAGDFDLSFKFCSPSGYTVLNDEWVSLFKLSACSMPQANSANDEGMYTKGDNKSAAILGGEAGSGVLDNRTLTIYSDGLAPVYFSTNYGNLTDLNHFSFKFSDFVLSQNGSPVLSYADAEPTKNLVREDGGLVRLKAEWEAKPIVLPTPHRDGFDFVEWNTKADGTGTTYKAGDAFTTDGDVTLYANWVAQSLCEPTSGSVDALLCSGDTLFYANKAFTKPGTYIVTLVNKQGCDSIVTLNVTAARVDSVVINDFIINQTHYERYGFNVDVQIGTFNIFTHVYKNQLGCDSLVILVLNSFMEPIPVYDTICKGESYTVNGESFTTTGDYNVVVGKYHGCECDSVMKLHLLVLEPDFTTISDTVSIASGQYTGHGFNIAKLKAGDTTYTATFKNQSGCDSTVTLLLTVTPYTVYGPDINESVCENETFVYNDSVYLPGNTYVLRETTAKGFDSIVYLNIKSLPTSAYSYKATVEFGETYAQNGFNLPAQEEVGVFQHELSTTNMFGCDSTVTLKLTVIAPKDTITIPTLFTPHTYDGKNDIFMEGYEVYIYDRYGNLVCHSHNGWNGKYRGEVADAGVYIYTLFLKDGRKKKGSIEIYK